MKTAKQEEIEFTSRENIIRTVFKDYISSLEKRIRELEIQNSFLRINKSHKATVITIKPTNHERNI